MGADFCDQQVTDYYWLQLGRNFAIEAARAATPLPVVRPDYGCAKAQDVAREHPESARAVESC
jgi:hypothetical protein